MGKVIIIAVIVAIIGVGAYIFLSGGKTKISENGIQINNPITNTTSDIFIGTIKMAIEKGIPIKCTTPKDETTGIEVTAGYFKGQKYYGEVIMKGKQGYIIMVGNCMWSWEKDSKQGAKTCFTGNIWDLQGESKSTYTCRPAIFSDSLFTPPSDVQFIDVSN